MLKNVSKPLIYSALFMALGSCSWQNRSMQEILSDPFGNRTHTSAPTQPIIENEPLEAPRSIVVCRSKQCAPAKLSMSREYIYNSLLHLFDNNNHQKALICQADATSHTCTMNYISLPITVGVTPAYLYMDYVKITDVTVAKGNDKLNLILNYNVTYNGQTPDCTPSKSILFAKNINHVILEDGGYVCKMTSIGQTTIKTVFSIDYIDLDYGYIGGYYSIGLSGPAFGGGNGYMLLRLPKDAYPLTPELKAPKIKVNKASRLYRNEMNQPQKVTEDNYMTDNGVEIFPIKK